MVAQVVYEDRPVSATAALAILLSAGIAAGAIAVAGTANGHPVAIAGGGFVFVLAACLATTVRTITLNSMSIQARSRVLGITASSMTVPLDRVAGVRIVRYKGAKAPLWALKIDTDGSSRAWAVEYSSSRSPAPDALVHAARVISSTCQCAIEIDTVQ
ncbi:MAG: hypothetical protein AB7K09_22310 [Planctomycetota bacterium]